MDDKDWQDLISTRCAARPSPVRMVTYRNKAWSSWAFPAAFADSSGVEFIVKTGMFMTDRTRAMATEQIVGSLGAAMGAPVAPTNLAELPKELIDINPDIGHLQPGSCHGSRRLQQIAEAEFVHVDQPENRARFAAFAALFGWTVASDHQFLYEVRPPYRVHSHDHGMFLPGKCGWTSEKLAAAAVAVFDRPIVTNCRLSADELRPALDMVNAVSPEMIATAVAAPPDEWEVTPDERLALAKFLSSRRSDLLALNSQP